MATPATSRNAPATTATGHSATNGYGMAIGSGQTVLPRYRAYETTALPTRSPSGNDSRLETAPPVRCTTNVTTLDAAARARNGAFSSTSFRQDVMKQRWSGQ